MLSRAGGYSAIQCLSYVYNVGMWRENGDIIGKKTEITQKTRWLVILCLGGNLGYILLKTLYSVVLAKIFLESVLIVS